MKQRKPTPQDRVFSMTYEEATHLAIALDHVIDEMENTPGVADDPAGQRMIFTYRRLLKTLPKVTPIAELRTADSKRYDA